MDKFLRGVLFWLSMSFVALLAGCGGSGSNANVVLPGGGGGSGNGGSNAGGAGSSGPVFGSFFGMNQVRLAPCDAYAPPNNAAPALTDAPIAAVRYFETCNIQWPDLEPSKGVFDFSGLDTVMSVTASAGVNDVMMEVHRIPQWLSSNPNDGTCDQANISGAAPGGCDPPTDIDAVPGSGLGDGTDASFIAYAQALLTHAVAKNYPLKYFEIFEEFHRSDTLGGLSQCSPPHTAGGSSCSWRGTFAQMLRMTQDLHCIAKGKASDIITATGATCGSYGQAGVDYDIMPNLVVSVGNAGPQPDYGHGPIVLANYLYCNQNPPPSSVCNYRAVGNTPSPGSASTDLISGHAYFQTVLPETLLAWVANQHSYFSTEDQAKPYFIGEGSWDSNTNVPDAGLQAAYITRWYLSLWITGDVQRAYWYSWDLSGAEGLAGLWSDSLDTSGNCTTPDPNADGGYYCSGGVAFNQMVSWMRNSTGVSWTCPDSNCTNQAPGVYTFTITGSNGYMGIVSWDSTEVSSCSEVPCGSTPVPTTPNGFTAAQWRDLTGTTHSGAPTAVGASPIIIENMAPPS